MSQSPEAAGVETDDGYARGWAAINKLMRRGYSWSGHERNCAYLNLGSGSFADVSAVSGFDFPDDGRALATIDWDLDGDTDVLLTNRNAPRLRFLENQQATTNASLTVGLLDADGQVAVGASVEVTLSDGQKLLRGLRAGEGYLAQSSRWLTVGIGGAEVAEVAVHWPGGELESFSGVAAGGRYELRRGTGAALSRPAPALARLSATPATVRDLRSARRAREQAAAEGRIVLATPVPVPELGLRSPEGQRLGLFGIEAGGVPRGTGRPVLLNVWASWCAPCVAELKDFRAEVEALGASGLALLAVSVDEDEAAATGALVGLDWPWPWAFAEPDAVEILDTLQGILRDDEQRLGLPTSFLFDSEGYLRVLYFGRLEPEVLLRDLEYLELSAESWRDLAVPFRGTWFDPYAPADLSFFEGRFEARGLPAAASQYARGRIQVRPTSRAQLLADFARRSAAQGNLDEAIATLREALALDPELFQAHFDLAVILHRQSRLVEAISAYLQALALDPDHEQARFNLGLAYLGGGDLPAARLQLDVLKKAQSRLAVTLEQEIVRREE